MGAILAPLSVPWIEKTLGLAGRFPHHRRGWFSMDVLSGWLIMKNLRKKRMSAAELDYINADTKDTARC